MFLDQSDSFIPKKSVPADIEDRDSKVEYKVQDIGLLHAVTKSGNIEIIASLLSQGFEVDSKDREGVTPLMYTAESSKEVAFQMLIQKGANASLKDNKGSSLLHRAATGGNTSIINKLLSLGLEIDTRSDDGFTPLMAAALTGKQSAFKMLLRHGANVSLKDN